MAVWAEVAVIPITIRNAAASVVQTIVHHAAGIVLRVVVIVVIAKVYIIKNTQTRRTNESGMKAEQGLPCSAFLCS